MKNSPYLNAQYAGIYYDNLILAPVEETPDILMCFSRVDKSRDSFIDSKTNLLSPNQVPMLMHVRRVSITFLLLGLGRENYIWNVNRLINNYHLHMWIGDYRYIQCPLSLLSLDPNSSSVRKIWFDCTVPLTLPPGVRFSVDLIGIPFILHKFNKQGGPNFFFQVALEGIIER